MQKQILTIYIYGISLFLSLSSSGLLHAQEIITENPPPTVNTTVTNTQSPSGKVTNTTTTTVTANPNVPSRADDQIVSDVYALYARDPALTGTSLTVTSQNGIVSVDGTVTSQSQADEAVIAAKKALGVKDVRSFINVTTNPAANKPIRRVITY